MKPLAVSNYAVYGTVYDSQDPPQPVAEVWVLVFKKALPGLSWTYIAMDQTDNGGNYVFDPLLGPWPAGWYGKVDCTNDDITAEKDFDIYPEEGPVEADIWLPLP
ncbi:MAG: hypothetical protein NTW26_05280 [bacterium]|nr:hypothetical protein [bacterium]